MQHTDRKLNQMTCRKGNKYQGLTPKTHPWMASLMAQGNLLKELITMHGSPVNILHMDPFEENIAAYRKLFRSFNLKHKIYFARKANKCKSFVRQAIRSGIGIDTASERELAEALDLGMHGQDLVLTSAIKTRTQIELAIKNKVTIILDNVDECHLVNSIAREFNHRVDVGVRVSGFQVNGEKLYSRFGFDIDRVSPFILKNIGENKTYDRLDLTGLHFHLNGYSIEERIAALDQCLELAKQYKSAGYSIQFIDMGGGILVNYLQSREEWESFQLRLKESLMKKAPPVTFQNNGLGYRVLDGKITGSLDTYPYYNEIHGAAFLKKIIMSRGSHGKILADELKKENIQLRIEPGRSLIDQSGITVARVVHRKQDAVGDWLVGLEMNMSQMMSSSADFLLDPFIIYQNRATNQKNTAVYFTGAYCLERDLLLKRKIALPALPEIGDLVVFVNTAGYMMHFFETEAHRFALAKNLVASSRIQTLTTNDFMIDDQASYHG